MSRDRDDHSGAPPDRAAPPGAAGGKRTLTDRLIRRAQRKNPTQERRLGFDPKTYSASAVDSETFAIDVAERQAAAGLAVDGVVGPETLRVVGGATRSPFDFLDGPSGHRGRPGQPHKVIGELSHREADADGVGCRVTAVIGLADRVSPQTRWTLCDADGQPVPGGALRVLTYSAQTTSLSSRLSLEHLPARVYAMATTPVEYLRPVVDDEPIDLTGLED